MTCKTATTYLAPGFIDSNGGNVEKFLAAKTLINRVNSLIRLPCVWQQRLTQRRHMLELVMDMENLYILDDMGIREADAIDEAQKPFWVG